jgi:hypothetical protein
VLSTPPAFVLSQNQTLQTKTPGQTRKHPHQNKPETNKKTPKTGIQKNRSHPQTGKCGHNPKQQTKTTKHTIEFSNNTPGFQATLPLYSM